MGATIHHLAFNRTSTMLIVSGSTDTVHIFRLTSPTPSSNGSNGNSSSSRKKKIFDATTTTAAGLLPKKVTSLIMEDFRDFSHIRLGRPMAVPYICAFNE